MAHVVDRIGRLDKWELKLLMICLDLVVLALHRFFTFHLFMLFYPIFFNFSSFIILLFLCKDIFLFHTYKQTIFIIWWNCRISKNFLMCIKVFRIYNLPISQHFFSLHLWQNLLVTWVTSQAFSNGHFSSWNWNQGICNNKLWRCEHLEKYIWDHHNIYIV